MLRPLIPQIHPFEAKKELRIVALCILGTIRQGIEPRRSKTFLRDLKSLGKSLTSIQIFYSEPRHPSHVPQKSLHHHHGRRHWQSLLAYEPR
jgi:hypothetical protein